MIKMKNLKLEQIKTVDILKDIEFQFEVNLKKHMTSMPNVYLVYIDTKSVAVVSKSLIIPIGLAYTLTENDIHNIKTCQNNIM